jgi:cupin 2 domain-containing protein
MRNLFVDLPPALPDEVSEILAASSAVRIGRIVSRGHASPEGFWYDQEEIEFVVLLKGAARLRFEKAAETIDLKPGDWLVIAAHERHRVEWTTPDEPTVWLAVHYAGGPSR